MPKQRRRAPSRAADDRLSRVRYWDRQFERNVEHLPRTLEFAGYRGVDYTRLPVGRWATVRTYDMRGEGIPGGGI